MILSEALGLNFLRSKVMYRFCHSCFVEINKDVPYCNRCFKALFDGNRKISVTLDFDKATFIKARINYLDKLSISGYQDKILLKIEQNKLVPTITQGRYILKPIPSESDAPFDFLSDLPANEHLTMHIASQFFNIRTAENALIYFSDGEPAYITKRFDYKDNGKKLSQEDFCQLLNLSEENKGKNYKYDYSYEKAVTVIKTHCRSRITIENYYKIIIFSYLFSNGDLHLKNFSLIESLYKDYILSPAYDLLSVSVHLPNDTRTALDFFEEYESQSFQDNGFYGYDDFVELARRFKIPEKRTMAFLSSFSQHKPLILDTINKSFLSSGAKERYIQFFEDKLRTLKCL